MNTTPKTNALSMKLFQLTEIVKLAAFAAEARRTLSRIQEVSDCHPDFKQTMADHVSAMGDWAEREDVAGSVLSYVAEQLEEVNSGFFEVTHGLGQAATEGGAA